MQLNSLSDNVFEDLHNILTFYPLAQPVPAANTLLTPGISV